MLAFSSLTLLAHGIQVCNSLQSASILFPVSAESIFNIEELRLTKDPGYRHGARSNLGELVISVVMSVWSFRLFLSFSNFSPFLSFSSSWCYSSTAKRAILGPFPSRPQNDEQIHVWSGTVIDSWGWLP